MPSHRKYPRLFKNPFKRTVLKDERSKPTELDTTSTANDAQLCNKHSDSSIEPAGETAAAASQERPRRRSIWPLSAILNQEESWFSSQPQGVSPDHHRRESLSNRARRRSEQFLRAVRVNVINLRLYRARTGECSDSAEVDVDLEDQLPSALQRFRLCGKFFDIDPVTQGLSIEELTDRREFIVVVAVSLLKYGSATHLTEAFMDAIATTLHVPAQCTALPGFLFISFNSPDMDPAKSQTRSLSLQASLDLDKLDSIDSLAGRIVTSQCSFKEAKREMYLILARPSYYSRWHVLLAYGISASMATMMFFGGKWWEGFTAFFLGVWVGVLNILAGRIQALGCIQEFVSAVTCAMIARFAQMYILPGKSCFLGMAIGSCVSLLPGLSITVSVTELASRAVVSGASRIFSSFTTSLQLGFGIAVGSRAILWAETTDRDVCANDVPFWFQIVGFFGLITSLVVLLNIRPAWTWTGIYMSAGVGFGTLTYLDSKTTVSADTQSFLAAVAVGVVGSVFARYSRRQPLSIVMCGILLLLPGATGIYVIRALFDDDNITGMQFGFKMFTVALSITIGLLVAKVLVVPAMVLARPFYQPALF